MEPKKTPLYDEHVRLGGKIADFAGWLMPLWYGSGQSEEHHATRKACGLFDICHMGEFEIKGKGSKAFISWMLTNDIEKLVDGQAQYNFMLNEDGGVVDDCIIYRFDDENWMLVVNAGDIGGDFAWLQKHAPADVSLKNVSDNTMKLDLQGPAAPKLMSRWLTEDHFSRLKFFRFVDNVEIDGMKLLVSRTGYTGEVGFELYADVKHTNDLWKLLMNEGKKYDMLPCGLGARDTLRTEAGLPLYGHELQATKKAVCLPWDFAMCWDSDFIGKKSCVAQKEKGVDYYVYPFIMEGRRKAMHGWEVLQGSTVIGEVLSGVIAPSLENRPIGFLGVNKALDEDAALLFRQQGRPATMPGKVTKIPFFPTTSRKKMSNFL